MFILCDLYVDISIESFESAHIQNENKKNTTIQNNIIESKKLKIQFSHFQFFMHHRADNPQSIFFPRPNPKTTIQHSNSRHHPHQVTRESTRKILDSQRINPFRRTAAWQRDTQGI